MTIRNKLLLCLSALLLLVMPIVTMSSQASAVSASDWNAGNIIDDSIFTNSKSMSVGDIQAWLNKSLANCDPNGTQVSEYGGGTRAQYGAAHGNPAPYTCLNNYYEVPKTTPGPGTPANNYGGKAIPAGAISAAQIIYNAAQTYNISPQVLLVKLGTESSGPLTSDTWPFLKQYTYAMGSHCPDTGPGGSANCDTDYAGFSIQVYSGAELLRYYLDNMNQSWWTYKKPYQTNSILWDVASTGCGASNVYIQSMATAALYTYTPYQPNAAALANMYGTGDTCSAYGNRNFWRVFNDWFGPTTGTPFFSNNGKVYITGDAGTYYYVPSQSMLNSYGFGTRFGSITPVSNAYLSSLTFKGNLNWIARFGSTSLPIYVIGDDYLHQFMTPDDFTNYGYSYGQESVLPAALQNSYATSSAMSPVLKQADKPEVYLVTSGKKQHITTPQAYTTLGSPVYSSRASVTVNSSYAASLTNGAPIATDGTIFKSTSSGNSWIYSSGTLYPTDSTSIAAWGVTLPVDLTSDTLISLLPMSSTSAQSFAQDTSSSTYYILDGGRKLAISMDQITADGLNVSQFAPLSSASLSPFKASVMSPLIQQTGTIQVYAPTNGKFYHIYSEPDLTGLGYSWSQLLDLSKTTMGRLPIVPSTSLFTTGSLVRVNGTLEVYLVDNTLTLRHVPSEDTMNQFGFTFGNVKVISSSDISGYTKSSDVNQYIKDASGNLWLADSGEKWSIDPTTSTAYGFTPTQFATVNTTTLNALPSGGNLGTLVRGNGTLPVYLIENGTKRWMTSEQALAAHGYTQSMVTVLSQAFINSIKNGTSINN